MDAVLIAQERDAAFERVAAGRADDVADEEEVERLQRRAALGFFRVFKK